LSAKLAWAQARECVIALTVGGLWENIEDDDLAKKDRLDGKTEKILLLNDMHLTWAISVIFSSKSF